MRGISLAMKQVHLIVALALASVLAAGCGSGGSAPGNAGSPGSGAGLSRAAGSLSFTVRWPAPSRLIPEASNSIKFVVTRDATSNSPVLAGTVVDKPSAAPFVTTATLSNLPAGNLVVTATAYPQTGAQGVPQASATLPVVVTEGQTTAYTIVLNSTIDHIDITPAAIAPATSVPVILGQTIQLTATARDAAGDAVVVAPTNLKWLSSNPNVVSVDASGATVNVTGVALGSPQTITVTEAESGKTGVVTVAVTQHTFLLTGSLTTPRSNNTATLLPSGKVLIAGESYGEIYDPATGVFSATGPMTATRTYHTATLLPNGTVLIAGGDDGTKTLSSAEIFDPAANGGTGGFTAAAGSMTTPRENHTATLLPNGKVLIAGGVNGGSVLSSAEIYDPATQTFTATGSMASPREFHTATLLKNGLTLIAGGTDGMNALNSAELYDPTAGTFSLATGVMTNAREKHTATLLANGTVLLAGGFNTTQNAALGNAEVYDPTTSSFTPVGPMVTPRFNHTATLLADGMRVLLAGGNTGQGVTASTEIYDPAANKGAGGFSVAGDGLNVARENHTATLLQNGNVLIAGGDNGTAALASAEITSAPL